MEQELMKGMIGVRGNTIFVDLLRGHTHHSTRCAPKMARFARNHV
jgi:hypothetical protein